MSFDPTPFELRRKRFAEEIGPDAIAVIPAGGEVVRNFDVHYPFRQDSDFFFLTGFPEPDAVAVLKPGDDEAFVLFVRPRDPEKEVWTGYRAGPEGAMETYGADAAFALSDLDAKLRHYLVGKDTVHYRLGNETHDRRIVRLLRGGRDQRTRLGVQTPAAIVDPTPRLHQMRLIKTQPEIERLRRACEISAEGHVEAMRYARPGLAEYHVQAALEYVLRARGATRDGYPAIVASGANAVVLHYIENDRTMADGDLLLIDAGAEYGHFSADITRTFPVNGTFTAEQRSLYEVVLAAQETVIGAVEPGASMAQLHDTSRRVLAEGLVELGLVPLGVEETIAMRHDFEFFYHGTGHWLGMDVHDAGVYRRDRQPVPLEPGMALTVEPGLYVAPDKHQATFHLLPYDEDAERERTFQLGATAAAAARAEEKKGAEKVEHPIPAAFRGLGIRIEDDILVTADGHENLTAAAPRSIEAVEAACAEEARLPYL